MRWSKVTVMARERISACISPNILLAKCWRDFGNQTKRESDERRMRKGMRHATNDKRIERARQRKREVGKGKAEENTKRNAECHKLPRQRVHLIWTHSVSTNGQARDRAYRVAFKNFTHYRSPPASLYPGSIHHFGSLPGARENYPDNVLDHGSFVSRSFRADCLLHRDQIFFIFLNCNI